MISFEFYTPTKIYFGIGKLSLAGDIALKFGNRALIVTGLSSMKRTGILSRLESILNSVGIKIFLFEGITPNPLGSQVDKGARIALENNCDMVVGLGGGSTIDAAKAIAAVAKSSKSIYDFLTRLESPSGTILPIIAIPTTAGTGSELSKAAIITDETNMRKVGFRSARICPIVAIVDPELTISVPGQITAETGFDVLSHAIETYISKKSNPITEMFSQRAIRLVAQYLPKSYLNGNNLEARVNMSYASMLMGFNLGNSSTCLPHRLQYPVGTHTNTSHAKGLAALFPAWLKKTYKYSISKFAQVARLLDKDASKGLDEQQAARKAVDIVTHFQNSIGLIGSLRDLGITFEMCAQLADEVTGSVENDPGYIRKESIVEIYKAAW